MPQRMETEAPPENRSTPVPGAEHSESRPPREPGVRRANRPFPRMLVGILILIVAAGAIALWIHFGHYESTDDAEIDGHINAISARVSGYVTKVNVDDNQYVDAGTVLAEIDPKDYQVALDQANASLADAQATAQALNINVPITSVNSDSQISA